MIAHEDIIRGWLIEMPPQRYRNSIRDILVYPLCKRSNFHGLRWLIHKGFLDNPPQYISMWTGIGEVLIFENTTGKIFSESWKDFGKAIGYWNSGTLRVGSTWPTELDKRDDFMRYK